MRNVVGIAIFVASAGACFACAPPQLAPKFSGDRDAGVGGAAGASPDAGTAARRRRRRPGRAWAGRRSPTSAAVTTSTSRRRRWRARSRSTACPPAADPNARLLLRNGAERPGRDPVHRRVVLRARWRPAATTSSSPRPAPPRSRPSTGSRACAAASSSPPGDTTTLDVDVPRDDRVGRHHGQRRARWPPTTPSTCRCATPPATPCRSPRRATVRTRRGWCRGRSTSSYVVQRRRGGQRHPDEPARPDRDGHRHRARRPRRRSTSTFRR